MSRLDDISDQFKSLAQRILLQIQESSIYVQLNDSYQSWPASTQKLASWASASVLILIVLFYPMSMLLDSRNSLSSFEEKRGLIRELFKTYRESSARPPLSVPPANESLRASINTILSTADLTPEQNKGLSEGAIEDSKIIPKSLVQHILEVRLSKLNIKQIVDIGTSLVGISDSVKMKDIAITAHAADIRYFDVIYKLYALNVPEPTPEPPPEVEAKPKKTSKTNKEDSKNGGDE